MACGQEGTGLHSRQGDLTEALIATGTGEGRHGLPEAVDGLLIVTLRPVGRAKKEVRQCLGYNVPRLLQGRGHAAPRCRRIP
jgi:hypothetical protein